jgi:hypothetical protein
MTLRTGYLILAAVLAAAVLVVLRVRPESLWSAFCLNVAAGVVGTFLTVLLVDNVIQRQADEREAKMVSVAMQQLRLPLSDHVRFWGEVFKAAAAQKPEPPPTEVGEFLNARFVETLKEFNLATNAPVSPLMPWNRYMLIELESYKSALDIVINKYAFVLDPDFTQCLEASGRSHLVTRFTAFLANYDARFARALAGLDQTKKLVVSPMVIEHLNALTALVARHNASVEESQRIHLSADIWAERIGAQLGSARLTTKLGDNLG